MAKLTREALKGIVKEVMKEEEDYQKVFNKVMAKFGINSPADLQSDEEKKKFFTTVDTIYKAKVEGLVGNQHKLDVDGDGKIGGDDLADLRASKNEARDANGNEFPELEDVKAAVKKIIQNNDVERLLRNKVIAYLQKEKGFTGAGNTNSSRLYDKVINDLLKH